MSAKGSFAALLDQTARQPVITGARVCLMVPEPADRAAYLAMTRASAEFHNPWIFPAADEGTFRTYIRRVNGRTCRGFHVRKLEDMELVGAVNVNDIRMGGYRSAELAYYGHADFAGQGYMTEGLGLVLDVAFGAAMMLHRLEVNVQPENSASLALINRLGFRKEGFSPKFLELQGQWRDHERWAILADEWRAR